MKLSLNKISLFLYIQNLIKHICFSCAVEYPLYFRGQIFSDVIGREDKTMKSLSPFETYRGAKLICSRWTLTPRHTRNWNETGFPMLPLQSREKQTEWSIYPAAGSFVRVPASLIPLLIIKRRVALFEPDYKPDYGMNEGTELETPCTRAAGFPAWHSLPPFLVLPLFQSHFPSGRIQRFCHSLSIIFENVAFRKIGSDHFSTFKSYC